MLVGKSKQSWAEEYRGLRKFLKTDEAVKRLEETEGEAKGEQEPL